MTALMFEFYIYTQIEILVLLCSFHQHEALKMIIPLIQFVFFILVQPTLDVLQKARSNMEHHLKEPIDLNIVPPNSFQSHSCHRTNRLD